MTMYRNPPQRRCMSPDALESVLEYSRTLWSAEDRRAALAAPKGSWVIPTGQSMSWDAAWESMKGLGGLPPHALLDDILMGTKNSEWQKDWRLPDGSLCEDLLATELVLYPASGGVFEAGKDFTDLGWTVPWKWISEINKMEKFVGMEGKAVFMEPEKVLHCENCTAVIVPDLKRTVVLSGFLQESEVGKVDELTRIPLQPSEDWKSEPFDNLRILRRSESAGIRFIVRQTKPRLEVNLSQGRYVKIGVARVGSKEDFEALKRAEGENRGVQEPSVPRLSKL
jgi:hypothetical protein